MERYQRQVILKEFGEASQKKLFDAKILVVGAGGLGCAALTYLAAAGVGAIGIIDNDVVSLSNLHRQVLYNDNDIGKLKSTVAKEKLQKQNPDINIISYTERITNFNAIEIIKQYNIVIDGTDNFSSKYMLNDACVLLDKPLVYGAISRFEGQVAVFNYKKNEVENSVNYRDLFPQPLKNNEVQNCEEAGVLGVLAGITGSMQASETIKIITGIGNIFKNKLLTFDILRNNFYEVSLCKNKLSTKLLPKTGEDFLSMNYDFLCEANSNIHAIDAPVFKKMFREKNSLFIDVREINELPAINFLAKKIPLSTFENAINNIDARQIILFCKTGKRSLKAAQILDKKKKKVEIYFLKDNIETIIDI